MHRAALRHRVVLVSGLGDGVAVTPGGVAICNSIALSHSAQNVPRIVLKVLVRRGSVLAPAVQSSRRPGTCELPYHLRNQRDGKYVD